MKPPTILSRTVLWQGSIETIETATLLMQSGEIQERVMTRTRPGAVIVAVNEKEEVLLLDSYRWVVEKNLIELPAGKIEVGEEALIGAQRELREEAGIEAAEWHRLGQAHGAQGSSDWLCHYFLARQLHAAGADSHSVEEHPLLWVPLAEAWAGIEQGTMANNYSIVGIIKALTFLGHLRLSRGCS